MRVETADQILRKRVEEINERTLAPDERAELVLDFLVNKFGLKADSEINERLYWDITCFALEWLNLFSVAYKDQRGQDDVMEKMMKMTSRLLYSFHYSMPDGDPIHEGKESHKKFYEDLMRSE